MTLGIQWPSAESDLLELKKIPLGPGRSSGHVCARATRPRERAVGSPSWSWPAGAHSTSVLRRSHGFRCALPSGRQSNSGPDSRQERGVLPQPTVPSTLPPLATPASSCVLQARQSAGRGSGRGCGGGTRPSARQGRCLTGRAGPGGVESRTAARRGGAWVGRKAASTPGRAGLGGRGGARGGAPAAPRGLPGCGRLLALPANTAVGQEEAESQVAGVRGGSAEPDFGVVGTGGRPAWRAGGGRARRGRDEAKPRGPGGARWGPLGGVLRSGGAAGLEGRTGERRGPPTPPRQGLDERSPAGLGGHSARLTPTRT